MPVVLLGLGYLLLAAAGAAAWGLALAGSLGPLRDRSASASRNTSLAVAGALAALAARWLVTWLLALPDLGFAQEKLVVGLPISTGASILAAVLWWMPRHGAPARGGAEVPPHREAAVAS
ncbi:MAG TPA: hypothetical protein VNT50_03630, partial [Microbacterium sp.]|uniref:hypothetical protein n=1 Tax=Microbacterium sp. TaxID=51671 RepID=UPI002CBC42ED